MNLVEIYDRVINWPSGAALTVTLAAAGAVALVAALLLVIGEVNRLARGLGILGVATLMVVLWIVHQQTVTERPSRQLTVVRMRYSERMRLAAFEGLVGVPSVAALVMSAVFLEAQRRLRGQVPSHLKAGRRHLYQKDHAAALREYNQAIQSTPELGEAYLGRGSVFNAMGETALALADFDRAIELDPTLAAAYLDRGKMRTAAGDLDAAFADFEQLMLLRPNDPESYLNRGICLVKKGQTSEAVADFHRVLKLTNHSDFADPAKNYLSQCEDQPGRAAPDPSGNGAPALPSSPQPRAQKFQS